MFLFLSYSFGIEMINTFIHSRSSLKNHTRSQTKMGNLFSDQNDAKTLPDSAAHTYIAYIREYPPRLSYHKLYILCCYHSKNLLKSTIHFLGFHNEMSFFGQFQLSNCDKPGIYSVVNKMIT